MGNVDIAVILLDENILSNLISATGCQWEHSDIVEPRTYK